MFLQHDLTLFVPVLTGINTLPFTYLMFDDVINASRHAERNFTTESNPRSHWPQSSQAVYNIAAVKELI